MFEREMDMTRSQKPRGNSRTPLTAESVHRMLGDLDETVVTEILTTGATSEELLEAQEWLNADDYMGARLQRPMVGVVARLCEILDSQLPEPDQP